MKASSRHRLMASTLLVGFASIAVPAFAQTAPTSTASVDLNDICAANPTAVDCLDSKENIVVTGSRIASPTLNSPSPLQVIDARDIQDSGQINVQNVLQQNPAVSAAPTYSRTNSNFLTSSAGVASIDLRSLGTSRTLVLINGHRTVSGVPGTNIVDLNTIPSQFIERVEVLTGGASSVYGSDAIAGVVNFIYKKNFSGIQLDAQTGITQRGDGQNYQLGALVGANLAEGRGNVMVYGGYTKEDAVYSADRARSAIDQNACYQIGNANGGCATQVNSGDNTNLFTAYRPFFSATTPGGVISFGTGATSRQRAIGPGGVVTYVNTNGLVHADGTPGIDATRGATLTNLEATDSGRRVCTTADPCTASFGAATGFNRSDYRTIAVPVQRYLLAFRGNYQITDHINAILEGNFAQSNVTTLLEPFPFASAGVNGTSPNACITGQPVRACGGYQPIETRLSTGAIVRNPFVPDYIYNNATDRTGDGLRDVSFTRRLIDFGPRTYTARRETYRILAGLNGDVFTNFKWDAYYTYGQTIESQVGSGQVNLASFSNALEVIPGPNGPICADATARAQGCQPANIFGGSGSISAAAVNYIQATQTRNTNVEQIDAGANISGDLFDLPDGPLGLAAGVEYRKETSSAVNDPLTTAGLNGGNAIAPTFGSFNVKEAYGELAIPILAHRKFFETLTLRGAGRISDYSLSAVKTVYSWNAGVEYAPIKDVRFRAVLAHATRAPNISELYAGRSQTFPTGLTDPCASVTLTSTTAASARCRRDPGVLNNINSNISLTNPNGLFILNQSDIQGISGFNQGNPNLAQETGNTFTVGTVINPISFHALRNVVITVDYFNIRIANLISAYGRQAILNSCYANAGATQDETFCQFITRRVNAEGANSPGSLQFINTLNGNFGRFQTTGIDATLSYRQPFVGGTVSTKLSYTRLFTYQTPGQSNQAGEEGVPWDRASGTLNFATNTLSLTARGNFIGRSYLPASFTGFRAGSPESRDYRLPSYFTLDLQARFLPADHYEFYAGVINATDTSTPLLISGIPGDNTGTETDAGTYDPIGRRFYAGVKLKF